MKYIINIFIRIWIVVAYILFAGLFILSIIGLWIPYWFLTGRKMVSDVINLADYIPDLPKTNQNE
jgi:uncharacterized membrane protein